MRTRGLNVAGNLPEGRSLVGSSAEMNRVRRLIAKAARSRLPVLILGESGTGKELVARAIFESAPQGQFVPIDCGSLVGTLVETELFGHVRGSFTGAVENKKGLIEVADGGTAFFDEIGDLPMEMQVKLLRLVQEKEFRALGSLTRHRVDIRVIAATHRPLRKMVKEERFREDLFYRLNVLPIRVPPLRERPGDIAELVDHFLAATGWGGSIDPSTLRSLISYDWPGNVRELKNCVERMVATNSGGVLLPADLPTSLNYHHDGKSLRHLAEAIDYEGAEALPAFTPTPPSPVISIRESEKQAISKALAASQRDRALAAKVLGIGRTTLYRKMKEYGIS